MTHDTRTKVESLLFSGKQEDFQYFEVKFEARCHLLKLTKILNGDNTENRKYDDINMTLWCELVQCLDRKSLLLVRQHKNNGYEAWKTLKSHYKSCERPRIQNLLQKLTNLKLEHNENVSDYLIRTEDLSINLEEANEGISESMLCSLTLKGLPREFEALVTAINFGGANDLTFQTLKRDLINFSASRSNYRSEVASFSKDIVCYNCKKTGHKQHNCPQPKIVCNKCKKAGHKANECHSKLTNSVDTSSSGKFCTNCKKAGHIIDTCYALNGNPKQRYPGNQGNSNTAEEIEHDLGFTFMSSCQSNTVEYSNDVNFIVDSGCTGFMLKDKDLFVHIDESQGGLVGCANATQSQIMGVGTAVCYWPDSFGKKHKITLKDAYYVPSHSRILLSVKRLNDAGAKVVFENNPMVITPNGVQFPILIDGNLFVINGTYLKETQSFVSNDNSVDHHHDTLSSDTLSRWHIRFAHNNFRDLKSLPPLVDGMTIGDKTVDLCEPCVTEKSRRAAISKTVGTRADKPLDYVHTDILGPLNEESCEGYRYAIAFVDSFSRYGTVYCIKSRDETFQKFQQFVADVGIPRRLVCDNAKEYKSKALQEFCNSKGVKLEYSAPYTPEDNGKVERKWGTVMGMVRTMLKTAQMPRNMWCYAIQAAFYIKNRCKHSAHNKTPFEVMFNKKPDVSHLRIFGCLCYAYVPKEKRKKLDSKAKAGVFVGYCLNSHAFLVLIPDEFGRMYLATTRNVTFNENQYYFDRESVDALRESSIISELVLQN